MKLYSGQIPTIAQELAQTLASSDVLDVEDENMHEFQRDIEAILEEYLRLDRELTDQAKDEAASSGGSFSQVQRIKRRLAKRVNFSYGEDALDWITQQLIEIFFQSVFVEEVYGEDHDLRRVMTPVLRRHFEVDQELDREVRAKIRNIQEGSRNWDIEYEQAMQRIRRNRGLE